MNKTDFYYQARAVKNIPSLIKWTGSKRSQVSMISGVMPPYKKYIEPFLGSGAMLFSAGYPGSIGGDVYAPLIDLWNLVKKDLRLL